VIVMLALGSFLSSRTDRIDMDETGTPPSDDEGRA